MISARPAAGLGAVLLTLIAAASATAAPADAAAGASAGASALDAVRQQCIAAARDTQQQEAAVAALQHQIDLLAADAAGRQRDLDDSRPEQAHLLGVLGFLAGNLGNPLAAAAQPPLDRSRGALLITAVAPELRAEARALTAEMGETARLRREVAARRRDLAAAEAALGQDRFRLAQRVMQRQALIRQLTPDAVAAAADLARIAGAAKDVGDLIRLADAAAERGGGGGGHRAVAGRPGVDPTRPAALRVFNPPQSALLLPVSGTIAERFGEPDAATGALSQGLRIAGPPGTEVVAPFDGQVVYAGPFRDLGLVLIIRHGALYHSLLAGLGRVDASADEWVLAGEPVGALPDVSAPNSSVHGAEADGATGRLFYFELRRDGQPVDPQPWLAKRDMANGEQRVSR